MPACQQLSTGRVNVYVDGFNLYHAIVALNDNSLKWLDHVKLAKTFLRDGEALGDVHFFTAVVTWDRAKSQRHVAYLNALRAVGVKVHEGSFRKQRRYCFEQERQCRFREEKKTDVHIGVSMLRDGLRPRYSRGILLTADTDQVPTIRALQDECPHLTLSLALPPRQDHVPRELTGLFSKRERINLSAGRLRRCLLPHKIIDARGATAAVRPAAYAP